MQRRREEVVQFIKSEHQKTGKAPSVRRICKELGLCKKALYEAFPAGMSAMCGVAGVPKDDASFEGVEKATQALKEKRIKEKATSLELDTLGREYEEIVGEVKRAQMADETQRRIKELEFEYASTAEGRRRIFSDPERMLKFASRTIDYESYALKNPSVWGSFVAYCKTDGLDLAKKLFEIAGSLRDYETNRDDTELHNHLGFRLEIFLIDREAEQKQKLMQAKFDDDMRKFKCECGRQATAMFLDGNYLRCPCGQNLELTCKSCNGKLLFDENKGSFACHRCNLFFTVELRPIDRSRLLLL